MELKRIGVFALQGDVSEHISAMENAVSSLGYEYEVITIRNKEDLKSVRGAILPGGESTTIYRLLVNFGLYDLLKERCGEAGMPLFGTCAGMVLLAKEGDEQVRKTDTRLMGLVNARVRRNAFGRQRESFETTVKIKGLIEPFPAVFIRAPAYETTGKESEVLSSFQNNIIMAKQGNVLVSAFHPELTDDIRVHELFLKMIEF